MGLDMVEFVMGVEEAFGIFIPDADAEHIRTPGQLVDYVEARVRAGAAPGCLEQRAFYRVRRAAMQVLKQPWKAVTPTTPWSALLHPNHRRRQWQLVAEVFGVRPWPALRPLFGIASATHSVGDTACTLAASTPAAFLWPEEVGAVRPSNRRFRSLCSNNSGCSRSSAPTGSSRISIAADGRNRWMKFAGCEGLRGTGGDSCLAGVHEDARLPSVTSST